LDAASLYTGKADGKAADRSQLAHALLLHCMDDPFAQVGTDCFTHPPSIA